MFNVLRRRFDGAGWNEWPKEYAHRNPAAITALLKESAREIAIEAGGAVPVRRAVGGAARILRGAQDQDPRRCGDLCELRLAPMCGRIRRSSSWTNSAGRCASRACRRITFPRPGQRWGNPLYKWPLLEEQGFDWWVARIRRALALYDEIRLDHFRGFEAYWSIAADEPTAINGQWVKAPGHALFNRLKEIFGELPFIAEDLGVITREVDELREFFGMPGMRDSAVRLQRPRRRICICRTALWRTRWSTPARTTTTRRWAGGAMTRPPRSARTWQTYLHPIEHEGDIVWTMIKAAAASVAKICIFPLQDILHLGSEARMNTPSESHGQLDVALQPRSAAS